MGSTDLSAELPALLMVPDLLPGGGPLNGRRWAGQQLLLLWLTLARNNELPLFVADENIAVRVRDLLRAWGRSNTCVTFDFSSSGESLPSDGVFVPDPSIGLWSLWRDANATPASFSLIGQIHTLCTTGAMTLLEQITPQNVFSWDALICSSTAGRNVVESVLSQREDQQAKRFNVSTSSLFQHRPQLPVIPLPMPVNDVQLALPSKSDARLSLGLPEDADVLLWIGRLTLLSKTDPAPTYLMLDRVASIRQRPLVLIELGPDDGSNTSEDFSKLRQCFKNLQFRRLGADAPVPESVKYQVLAAADLGLSLVDNIQETFGQSVVEMMAAGLPVVVSDWDGYRDLVHHGRHGFRVRSRWSPIASEVSTSLGWQHRIGLQSYPVVAGSLAQLVQLDLEEAEAAIILLLDNTLLRRKMGYEASRWALETFDRDVVARQYNELFVELRMIRAAAPSEWQHPIDAPLGIDPVKCFRGFASVNDTNFSQCKIDNSNYSDFLAGQRKPLWDVFGPLLATRISRRTI